MNKIKSNPHWIFILFFSLLTACKAHMPLPFLDQNLPNLENFTLDGTSTEWSRIEGYRLWADPLGRYPDSSSLEAHLKVAHDQNSLLLMLDVNDDVFESDTLNPWNGDAIQVFLSPFRGSDEILQIAVIPFGQKDFIRVNDLSKTKIFTESNTQVTAVTMVDGQKRVTEIRIGSIPSVISIGQDKSFAMQVYVNDADSAGQVKAQLVWYPVGQSYNSSSSMYTVKSGSEKQFIPKGSSRLVITDNEKIALYVFGAENGDNIGIYRNGNFLRNFKSKEDFLTSPDTIDLNPQDWNIENDSLFVTLNGQSLGFHELFLAPRINLKSPEKRFDREIRNFMFADRIAFPPKNATLFVGSSSIVRWETLKQDFPELQIIQRGFGGSVSSEALMYIFQIVLPYKPANIVYYEGDNDIPLGVTPQKIVENVKSFIDTVKLYLPETKIYILSPKPSPSRMNLWEKYKETHLLLTALSREYENVEYIDVSTPLFDKDGKLRTSLFVEDGIHMNQAGYAIWTDIVRKALKL